MKLYLWKWKHDPSHVTVRVTLGREFDYRRCDRELVFSADGRSWVENIRGWVPEDWLEIELA